MHRDHPDFYRGGIATLFSDIPELSKHMHQDKIAALLTNTIPPSPYSQD